MDKKNIFFNIITVLFGRIVTLFSGLVTGFIVPKILGVTDYGYFKIYSLYMVYTALLHFGFIDGILLKFAGKDYATLNKKQMRTFTQFFLAFQFGISLLICSLGLFFDDINYKFIVIALGINMYLNNMTTYYQFISQATQRFKEYSFRSVLAAILKTMLVALILIFNKESTVSFMLYALMLSGIDAILLVWYIYTYRDITFGKHEKFKECRSEIVQLFKKGILLTFAYQISHLAFALDRQFVSLLFSTATYGIYSFAYSIINLFSQLISSISTVLFPVLKKGKKDTALQYYTSALAIISLISGAALSGYFVLKVFVEWYLPDYFGAIEYLRIIMPSLMLTSGISVVMFTYYKIVEKNDIYFGCGCFALILGCIMNLVAYHIFKTPQAISWASIFTILCWYYVTGLYFTKNQRKRYALIFFYIVIIETIFYVFSALQISWWKGMIGYLVIYFGISIFYIKIFNTKQGVKK